MTKQDLIDKIVEIQAIIADLPSYEDGSDSDSKLEQAWQICEDALVNYKI